MEDKKPDGASSTDSSESKLLKYVKDGRLTTELSIGNLTFVIRTRVTGEDFLVERIANEENMSVHQMRVLGGILSIAKILEKDSEGHIIKTHSFEPLSAGDYKVRRDELMRRYAFFENKGSAITDAVALESIQLEQTVRDIVNVPSLKNL